MNYSIYIARIILKNQIKSSLQSRGIGEAHLRRLAPAGQHSFEETSQRWRAVADTV